MLIGTTYLTPISEVKLKNLPSTNCSLEFHGLISKAFEQSISLGCPKLDLKLNPDPINPKSLQNLFIDFDQKTNDVTDSKFQSDVSQMTKITNHILTVSKSRINIQILSKKLETNLTAAILMAINWFGHLFEYDYNGLTISVCLDDNKRDVIESFATPQMLNQSRSKSIAFNVSGLTQRNDKIIILTKKEEIIKLLFHELIHFVGLDHVLVGKMYNVKWQLIDTSVNVSEAYTEFLSIVLHCMWLSVHLGCKIKINPHKLFHDLLCVEIEYSVYLSASILKLYGYTKDTYKNFFKKNTKTDLKYSPICTWEYVYLRAILFLHLEQIDSLPNFRLTNTTKDRIIKIFGMEDILIERMKSYMNNMSIPSNISYICIDLDWNNI